MPATSIRIRVNPETAQAFREASAQQKERALSAFESALTTEREATRRERAEQLRHVMDELGSEARAKGLTDEKLGALLREIDGERDVELGIVREEAPGAKGQ